MTFHFPNSKCVSTVSPYARLSTYGLSCHACGIQQVQLSAFHLACAPTPFTLPQLHPQSRSTPSTSSSPTPPPPAHPPATSPEPAASTLHPRPRPAPVLQQDTFRVVAQLGRCSLGTYVISMAKSASDVLAVELLQREAQMQVEKLEGRQRDLGAKHLCSLSRGRGCETSPTSSPNPLCSLLGGQAGQSCT